MKNHLDKLSFFMLLIAIASCKNPVKRVVIDNPSDDTISIKSATLDELTILPRQVRFADVPFGEFEFVVNNEDTVNVNLDPDYDYLLNPLKEGYYLQTLPYFVSKRAEELYYDNFGQPVSKIGTYDVNGYFEKIEDQYAIKKTWDFGVNENPSQRGAIQSTSNKGYVRAYKLHRESDLRDTIRSSIMNSLQELIDSE